MSDRVFPAGDSVVARADALMQRRRPQPARPPPDQDLPVLTEAVLGPEDDLPVLTVIASGELTEMAPQSRLDPALLEKLAQELTRRVHDRLAAELPSLVEAALQTSIAGLSRELEQGLIETTEAAIRDFIDEWGSKRRR
ncbi:MAG: hypothetical protein BWY57_01195 [Betaproteobacteria bacterium ADurb.Bin341]|nr:MAG: hypothetical protein BWY57_01195 [Betaproteobacteria bacterium ADurb.Bin341]